MGALETPRITVEEYLAAEERAELPSEYHGGEVLPIEGASNRHALIAASLGATLVHRLKGMNCAPMAQPHVRATARDYIYPDFAVVCPKTGIAGKSGTIDNPKVVLEILSPNTEDYDHGRKFKFYRNLSAFEEYVLVSQEEPHVEVFRKQSDNAWVFTTYQGLDVSFELKSLQISIPLAEVYENVTWEG